MVGLNFTPLNDVIIVKPDPLPGESGLIITPQAYLKPGYVPGDYEDSFLGVVVATGPGDKLLTLRCECGVERKRRFSPKMDGRGYPKPQATGACSACGSKEFEVAGESRIPMLTKIGDRVVFPRRPSSAGGEYSLMIDGERYIALNEEQNAFAVVETAAA